MIFTAVESVGEAGPYGGRMKSTEFVLMNAVLTVTQL